MKLSGAGFEQVEVEPTRTYRAEDAKEFFAQANLDVGKIAPLVDGKFMSAFVRARKTNRVELLRRKFLVGNSSSRQSEQTHVEQ